MQSKNIRFRDGDNTTLLPLAFNIYNVTWAQLKAFRDAGKLHKGMRYRVTDYQCATTQANTQSAGHQFDIIVTALSEDKLSEEASAIRHDGDETLGDAKDGVAYFANCDLQAWRLLYCLDNDTSRFAWADAENGKGVVYRMVDEHGNNLPYDFKNIQFKRSYCTFGGSGEYIALPGLKPYYDGSSAAQLPGQDDSKAVYCYTFSYYTGSTDGDDPDLSQGDASIGMEVYDSATEKNVTKYPSGNIIVPRHANGARTLPGVTFQQLMSFNRDFEVSGNLLGAGCHDIVFNATATTGNHFLGSVEACVFAEETAGNEVTGIVKETCFAKNVKYNDISGSVSKCSVGGTMNMVAVSGTITTCVFKAVYSSVFSSETLKCTFANNVRSCAFQGLCNGFSFTGSGELRYLRQAGQVYVQDATNKGSLPTVAMGAKYAQLLTADADGNVVVKTIN